jgi:hypothetical protein
VWPGSPDVGATGGSISICGCTFWKTIRMFYGSREIEAKEQAEIGDVGGEEGASVLRGVITV